MTLAAFRAFCAQLQIPSKDQGLVPFAPWWGTQEYLHRELQRAREDGIHEVIICKGRQEGVTTYFDAHALFYLQTHPGLTGILVSDDDDNRDYRRDVLLQMLGTLPKSYRWPVRLSNRGALAWTPPNGSRLLFAAAGSRMGSNLGRSRGLNYLLADEVGSWVDFRAIAALRAAFSRTHPERFYAWNSTARGFNPFHDLWQTAQRAVTQRAIFIGWWWHQGYRIERSHAELWAAYGTRRPSVGERQWMRAVKDQYAVTITPEQLAWYRWQLVEEFLGDEALLAQEFPVLAEDAFQAFGEKFIAPTLVQKVRLAVARQPRPEGYTYEWGPTLDESRVKAAGLTTALLRVWEEPQPDGVYVLSAHPSRSSSPGAAQFVCQAWRAWPDHLGQVAEYAAEQGAMYQFAWVIGHLGGAYRPVLPPYLILEVNTTGLHVLNELQRLEQFGYGLSPIARRGNHLLDFLGSMQQYFYRRPDTYSTRPPLQWKTGPTNRPWLLHGLRDELERGHVTVRSPELVDELAMLRVGEAGDADQIAAGGLATESRAVCAALAVECWLKQAMPDLLTYVPPKTVTKETVTSVEQRLVQNFLGGILR